MRWTPLAFIACLIMAFAPMTGQAHVGHGAPGLALDLERVDRKDSHLTIKLRLENAGEDALILHSFSTDLGVVAIVDGDPVLEVGEVEYMTLSLEVKGDMPGIFTLLADFGEAGAGPVLIFTGA